MTGLLCDLRYAIRQLAKSPGFAAIAILTIAIGIATNVSIFTFMDALFLRGVPGEDPSRVVRIVRAPDNDGVSVPEYVYLRDHVKTLGVLAAHYSTAPLYVTANHETSEVQGAVVSSNYLQMLGLQPYAGRFFTAEEDSVPDRDAVAVVGYGFWKRTYNADRNILGKTLVINGQSFAIIGIMPPEFRGVEIGGMPNEIWIPNAMIRVGYRWCDGFQSDCPELSLMGRLAPGKSANDAQAEIAVLLRQPDINEGLPEEKSGPSVTQAIGITSTDYFNRFVRLLTTIGGVLFLIICANLGGLLLARERARTTELAMRQALGATRTRIIRQLLTESLLLACAGGVLGLVISLWTSQLLAGFYSIDEEGYRHVFDLRLDVPVLAYSLGVTILAGLLFGLLPSWQASRPDLNQILKSGGANQGSGRKRSRTALVAAQVALSLALLVGAGLMAKSTSRLRGGANMNLSHVLGVRLRPQLMKYPPAKAQAFTREVLQRLGNLPGVESVSLAKGQGLVWSPNEDVRMMLPGENYAKSADEPVINSKPIAPRYFATLGIPFVGGQDFTNNDHPESTRVVIVNETLAHKISSDKLPLERTILLDDTPYRVIGIVKDAQLRSIVQGPEPVAYVAYWQDASMVDSRMCVRVIGSPSAALPMIRRAIASVDPNVPVTEMMPLMEQVRGVYTDARVANTVLGSSAAIGLLLSAIGLYGVIAYEVNGRVREIGIRMAVGALPWHVVSLFLWQGFVVILAGSAAGLVLALLTTRLLTAWLFAVQPFDPATFLAALIVLLVAVLLASYIPARRAAKVDPMVALRYE